MERRVTPSESPLPSIPADRPPSVSSAADEALAKRTRWRVWIRIVPWLFFLYILAFLDRVNVSVAELKMEDLPQEGGLGFGRVVIGFGFGLFFWGYWLLEIPSTVSVNRWGARWVFVRILVLWGLCAAAVGAIGTSFAGHVFGWIPHVPEGSGWLGDAAGFVNGLSDNPEYQFYFLRFMLGFFEGGFFPSVIFYLSLWFRTEDRAKAIATFMAAIPFANLVGAPLSGLLLEVHWSGLPGWRWVFILEGIAPVLAGVATLFLLPDRPATVTWLRDDERAWLLDELEREHHGKKIHNPWIWVSHLGMVILLTLVYFGQNLASYGLTSFLPAIIKSILGLKPDDRFSFIGMTVTSDQLGTYLSGPIYLMGLIGMLISGWHSDRTRERIWHSAVPLALWGVGIALTAMLDGYGSWPLLVLIFGVGTFMYAHLPAFWPIPTMFLGAVAAASAIGFINMLGNLGGYVGPKIMGDRAKAQMPAPMIIQTVGLLAAPQGQGPLVASVNLLPRKLEPPRFAPILWLLAPWPILSAVIILAAGYLRRRSSRLREGSVNPVHRPLLK
jgi:ACS family tartrate transporter-like MFS transporter